MRRNYRTKLGLRYDEAKFNYLNSLCLGSVPIPTVPGIVCGSVNLPVHAPVDPKPPKNPILPPFKRKRKILHMSYLQYFLKQQEKIGYDITIFFIICNVFRKCMRVQLLWQFFSIIFPFLWDGSSFMVRRAHLDASVQSFLCL